MKLKQLESLLQEVQDFQHPKILLEQYPTPPHIASRLLYTAQQSYEDIQGSIVADLGSGTGMLSIGASLLGASLVNGFEIDPSAISIALDNVKEIGLQEPLDFIQMDALRLLESTPRRGIFDTVLMNPPFGTKRNKGTDMLFLKTGLALASTAVYSLHKTSTREHILRKAKEWDVRMEVLANLRCDLPQTYKHHKHTSVDIQVDLLRFSFK
uniref:Methyltransferase-like protein 5 n=1 Tax=Caligus clemensi TaxID=344056 RepID=C1C2W1_CALCM|nr:Methyltransferase-like protein 5 [Caligus clemensi]